jgi:hypothetical protein
MTTRGLNRLLALMMVLTAGAAGVGCSIEPSAAGQPTYEADVRPILMARCIRCHGSPPLADSTAALNSVPTNVVRFDFYGDTSCAAADAGAACVTHGAIYEAMMGNFTKYLHMDRKVLGMPPEPAPALTSYQLDTIVNWEKEASPLEK